MAGKDAAKLPRKVYENELLRLQTELVKLQEWVRAEGTRRFYALDGDGLDAAQGWLAHLRDPMAAFAQPLDALATEVARGRRAARRAAPSSRAAGGQVGTDRDASGAAGA